MERIYYFIFVALLRPFVRLIVSFVYWFLFYKLFSSWHVDPLNWPLFTFDSSESSGNWRQYLNLSAENEGDSAPEPSTARAPVREEAHEPSTSSTWSGSWIGRWFNREGAPNEGGHEATSQPTGVMEQAGPSRIAPPGASSTGLGPQPAAFPTKEEVESKVDPWLSSFSHIKARADFVMRIKDELDLRHASPETLGEIVELMDDISNDPNRPSSGREAAKLLMKKLKSRGE